ncbi:MAG: RNA methyltransferase [Bacteroidales bacterium]|nr:RNA methyltransferase [Bacteroidales bacterium]
MLGKNKVKHIHSLEHRKHRKAEQAFVAEGHKLVGDLLGAFQPRTIIATAAWAHAHPGLPVEIVTDEELGRASLLKHPQDVLAVFAMRPDHIDATAVASMVRKELCLAIDGVQDPGNVGTILRIADWFGIHHIFCSESTADVYGPKCVQATMGALSRVHAHTVSLPALLSSLPASTPVYGTFLNGHNIYREPLTPHGLIVMGNEGNGISPDVATHVTHRLFIPSHPVGAPTSESLNVAVATAIVCAEFRRRS